MRKVIVALVVLCFMVGAVAAATERSDRRSDRRSEARREMRKQARSSVRAESVARRLERKVNKTVSKPEDQVDQTLRKANADAAGTIARLRVVGQLHKKIRVRKAEVGNETRGNREKTKQFKNQNVVRERVMALLALRDETKDRNIGVQVAEVARNFSNSIDKTQRAEKKINGRNWVRRFFLGGDHNAAGEIENEVQLNRGRIIQLMRLRSGLSPEYKAFMDEQVAALEYEQDRLDGLAKKEKESKGLLGWLYK
jgi:hypothetical protein